jgi:hypothetical protein
MQRHATVATLKDLTKQTVTGRMTIGIDLGDRQQQDVGIRPRLDKFGFPFQPWGAGPSISVSYFL